MATYGNICQCLRALGINEGYQGRKHTTVHMYRCLIYIDLLEASKSCFGRYLFTSRRDNLRILSHLKGIGNTGISCSILFSSCSFFVLRSSPEFGSPRWTVCLRFMRDSSSIACWWSAFSWSLGGERCPATLNATLNAISYTWHPLRWHRNKTPATGKSLEMRYIKIARRWEK